MMYAPIALFVYNRPLHLKRTIEALQVNRFYGESTLVVYSDGPRSDKAAPDVAAVRAYLRSLKGPREIRIVERERNYGLAGSVIAGVNEVVRAFGCAIVLEDDLVTSPLFLQYANEALQRYEDDERVGSVHGYVYPVRGALPETFFLRGADCWGWATWKRAWDLFEPDGKKLLQELRTRDLERAFDFNGAFPYTKMLKEQIRGRNDSWAIRWHASLFLKNKLTLYPGRSLVFHNWQEGAGTHCGSTSDMDVTLATEAVRVADIPVQENPDARKRIEAYFRSTRRFLVLKKIRDRIRGFRCGR